MVVCRLYPKCLTLHVYGYRVYLLSTFGLTGGRVYVNGGVSLVPQVSDPMYGLECIRCQHVDIMQCHTCSPPCTFWVLCVYCNTQEEHTKWGGNLQNSV